MVAHEITGWKKHQIDVYETSAAVDGIKEEIVDILGEGGWECSCGMEFETVEDAKDHLWEQ